MEFAASGKERRAGEVMGTEKGGLTWVAGVSTGRQDSLFTPLTSSWRAVGAGHTITDAFTASTAS